MWTLPEHWHFNNGSRQTKILYYHFLSLSFSNYCCICSGKSTLHPHLHYLPKCSFFMAWRLLIGRRGKPMRCSLPMAQLLANLAPILLPPPALLILLSSPNWPSVPPTSPPTKQQRFNLAPLLPTCQGHAGETRDKTSRRLD